MYTDKGKAAVLLNYYTSSVSVETRIIYLVKSSTISKEIRSILIRRDSNSFRLYDIPKIYDE